MMCVATFLLLLGGAEKKVVTHTPAWGYHHTNRLLYKLYIHAVRDYAAFEAFR